MPKVLLFTEEQKAQLEGFYNGVELAPIKDADNNWVVSTRVIENGNFLEIRAQLEALPHIEYKPKSIE